MNAFIYSIDIVHVLCREIHKKVLALVLRAYERHGLIGEGSLKI